MAKQITFSIIMLTLFTSCSSISKKENTAQTLFKDYWEAQLDNYPELASSLGDRRSSQKVTDMSLAAIKARQQQMRDFYQRATNIDMKSLTPADQSHLKILIDDLDMKIKGYQFPIHLMPLGPLWGFHTSFAGIHRSSILENKDDYQKFIQRLEKYPLLVEQNLTLLRKGIEKGIVPPKSIFKGYETTFSSLISKKTETSPYFIPFKKLPNDFSATERQKIREQVKSIIISKINPANQKALKFWQQEYYPKLRDSIAISDLPGGRAFYEYAIREHTTLPLSAQSVHDTGLKEVARIRAEMKAILKKVNFKGSLRDFQKHLRTSAKYYAKTPEELMEKTSFFLKRMDGELPKLFRTLPQLPYGIKKVPDYMAPKQTTAYYMRGSKEAGRAGFYFVNTYDLRSRPLYEVEVLSYHEAVPGHHLQIALAQELPDVPEFRKHVRHTSYTEGWGLYSESLGKEVGFYENPYNDYGRLVYELWRACRLVVDTGMHAFGWSREKAINYLLNNSGVTRLNATSEVDRYISWPGQALAYKIGQLKIEELKLQAKKRLGNKFDIRDFHDAVLLSGSVPLKVLEENVNEYIDKRTTR